MVITKVKEKMSKNLEATILRHRQGEEVWFFSMDTLDRHSPLYSTVPGRITWIGRIRKYFILFAYARLN
jgi:hypothetical protein